MKIVIREDTLHKLEETTDIEYLRQWALIGFALHSHLEDAATAIGHDAESSGDGVEDALWTAGCSSLITDRMSDARRAGDNLMETREESVEGS